MGKKDARVDAYIAEAREFARPILTHLRELVHEACPEIVETTKWRMPFFEHKGTVCHMAAFKEHCSFGFWKGDLFLPKEQRESTGMGHFGKIKSITELPNERVLLGYIKEAARLNEEGIKRPARPRAKKEKKELEIPKQLTSALKKSAKAKEAFEEFSYSHKKEYLDWITEAKTEETRQRRVKTAIEWMETGKSRNWKYQNCQTTRRPRGGKDA